MNVRITAPRSSLFERRPTLKSDSSPERMAMTWLIWERVRVVKTIVCQISGVGLLIPETDAQRHQRYEHPGELNLHYEQSSRAVGGYVSRSSLRPRSQGP